MRRRHSRLEITGGAVVSTRSVPRLRSRSADHAGVEPAQYPQVIPWRCGPVVRASPPWRALLFASYDCGGASSYRRQVIFRGVTPDSPASAIGVSASRIPYLFNDIIATTSPYVTRCQQ